MFFLLPAEVLAIIIILLSPSTACCIFLLVRLEQVCTYKTKEHEGVCLLTISHRGDTCSNISGWGRLYCRGGCGCILLRVSRGLPCMDLCLFGSDCSRHNSRLNSREQENGLHYGNSFDKWFVLLHTDIGIAEDKPSSTVDVEDVLSVHPLFEVNRNRTPG